MENTVIFGKDVNVVAYYFKEVGRRLKCYPKRVEYDGRQVTFEDGLIRSLRIGERIINIFDMSDGDRHYQLEFDHGSKSWRLVNVDEAARTKVQLNSTF